MHKTTFDEFLNQPDKLNKYKDLQSIFSEAQSKSDINFIKKELIDVKSIPLDVIEFFCAERLKQLGPQTKDRGTIADLVNTKIEQYISGQQMKGKMQRPTEFGPTPPGGTI